MLLLCLCGLVRKLSSLLKRLGCHRDCWRQDSALQSHRELQFLLPPVVPLDEGVLVHLNQLNICALHHEPIAGDNLSNLMVIPKN